MRKMHCSKSMRFHIVFANVKTMVWLREVISVSRLSGRLAKACQSGRQGLSLKIEIKFPGTGFAGHAIPKSIVCYAHRIGFKHVWLAKKSKTVSWCTFLVPRDTRLTKRNETGEQGLREFDYPVKLNRGAVLNRRLSKKRSKRSKNVQKRSKNGQKRSKRSKNVQKRFL
jgi:hypothetical protein